MSRLGVIYMLENKINGKRYVGQTVQVNERMSQHRSQNEEVIDKAIDKYGYENFRLEILEDEIPESKLDTKEREYIAKNDTYEKGYNCTVGGQALRGKEHPRYGKELTEKTKQKISDTEKGKKLSEETKQKMSEAHKGMELPEKFKQKMNESILGKDNPMYGVRRTGKDAPMYGKKHTEKTKQKIGRTQEGRHHSKETLQKMSRQRKGVKNPNSKISKEEGKEILEKYEENNDLIMRDLADKYDISRSTVGTIVNKKHWTTRDDSDE